MQKKSSVNTEQTSSKQKRRTRFFPLLFWLLVWALSARLLDNNILLVGPIETLKTLLSLLPEAFFWQAVATSFLHIGAGFLLALLLAVLLGFVAEFFPPAGELLSPLLSLMKAIPVASFVILALIWLGGSTSLSTVVSFVVVFPMVYQSTRSGISSVDRGMLELAGIFGIPLFRRIRYIYLPALLPYLKSCLATAVGMCWKSGVAAELIGQPRGTIGASLYEAKIYLDTSALFAWTFTLIVISYLSERFIFLLLSHIPGKEG